MQNVYSLNLPLLSAICHSMGMTDITNSLKVAIPKQIVRSKVSFNSVEGTSAAVVQTPDRIDISKFLYSLPEFSLLPESELKKIANVSRVATLTPGQYIVIEGEEQRNYGFIIVSGCMAMIKSSISGKELIVELLQAKDIFGLLLMLSSDALPAQLSARALRPTKILWVPRNSIMDLMKSYPLTFKKFISHLLVNLHSSYCLSRGLAHDRVGVRIATILIALASKFSNVLLSDKYPTVDFTRQQLADLTGTTPETAIRETRAMQRSGLIDISRPGVIKIVNIIALQEMVDA